MNLFTTAPKLKFRHLQAKALSSLCAVVLGLAGLLLSTTALTSNHSAPLNVAIYHQLPPFAQIKDQQFKGLLVDFSRPLGQQLQRPIRFHSMPLGRDVIEFIKGNMDVAFLLDVPGLLTPPSKSMGYVTPTPIMSFPLNIYYLTSREHELDFPTSFEKMSDLLPLRLGAIRAGGENNFTDADNDEWLGVVSFNQYEGLTKALLAKRVDLAMMDSLTAAYWKNNYGFDLSMKYQLTTVYAYVAFSTISLGAEAQDICNAYWQQLLQLNSANNLSPLISKQNYLFARQHILADLDGQTHCQEMKEVFNYDDDNAED